MSTFKGFSSVELRKPQRSKFDLSHESRLSTRMGRLTPIFITETMPNDTFHINSEVMIRLAPLLAPIMHRVNVYVHFFFVPNRLLWKDWETFITGGRLGTETPPVPPNVFFGDILSIGQNLMGVGSLYDYLGGYPITDADESAWGYTRTIDVMPFVAYQKVWMDYYRDRNFVDDDALLKTLPLSSGYQNLDVSQLFQLRTRAWEKDYFTSALPWTQRGSEVLMPLSGTGTVTYLDQSQAYMSDGVTPLPAASSLVVGDGISPGPSDIGAGTLVDPIRIENIDEVSLVSSDVSINDLRRAVRLQEWLERNALAGSRYNESIMAHFGRKTSDSRLQRAEYLGGGKVAVKISEVVTTAFSQDADANVVPPANMSGHGISFGNTNKIHYNCEEHGFLLAVMSVMPSSGYMQGIPRMFLQRNTFLDYPWPSFAHLGEQEVYSSELFTQPSNVPADRTTQPVFGYQSRYADWKYIPSGSHGDFRLNLDFWHLTRKFSTNPVLSEEFVTFEDSLQDRVFAVEGVDTLWCYIYNDVKVVRSLPYFGTPLL